jgi:hypothetical protein
MADRRVAGLHEYCFSQGENGLLKISYTTCVLKNSNHDARCRAYENLFFTTFPVVVSVFVPYLETVKVADF